MKKTNKKNAENTAVVFDTALNPVIVNTEDFPAVADNTHKITNTQLTANYMKANGFEEKLFSSATLNRYTKQFYTAMAKGNVALWDMAEALSAVETAISNGEFEEVTSFTAYCETIGIDKSNYNKYIRAFREYSELKYAGFSIGVAVALLGCNESASDIIKNFTPMELTVKKAREFTKSCKALETSDNTEDSITNEEKVELNSLYGQAVVESEETESEEEEPENKYTFTKESLIDLITIVLRCSEIYGLTSETLSDIAEYPEITEILSSAKGH